MTKVAVTKKGEMSIQQTVKTALDAIDAQDILEPYQTFLLKPNYVYDKAKPIEGNLTSSETIEGVIQYLLDLQIAPEKIIVGEGSFLGTTEPAFDVIGIRPVVAKYGVHLVNLNRDVKVKVTVPKPLSLQVVNVAKTALDVDALISIPSLKTHSMAITTLCCKNLMGCILPKNIMHNALHKKIADLTHVLMPKLGIIDGIIGSDGHEASGNPIQMDLIIASQDSVAADRIGSAIIGYGPDEARYLKFLAGKGLGEIDLDKINIIGAPIETVTRTFVRGVEGAKVPASRGDFVRVENV